MGSCFPANESLYHSPYQNQASGFRHKIEKVINKSVSSAILLVLLCGPNALQLPSNVSCIGDGYCSLSQTTSQERGSDRIKTRAGSSDGFRIDGPG